MVKYKHEQMEAVNELLASAIISKFSHLKDQIGMFLDGGNMKDDLSNCDVRKKDLKKMVGQVRPYLLYIGIITGGVIVASHV